MLDGIELSFTDDAIMRIAQKCIDLNTGARGLHTEVERVLMHHMFHIRKYKEKGITELIIDADMVDHPKAII